MHLRVPPLQLHKEPKRRLVWALELERLMALNDLLAGRFNCCIQDAGWVNNIHYYSNTWSWWICVDAQKYCNQKYHVFCDLYPTFGVRCVPLRFLFWQRCRNKKMKNELKLSPRFIKPRNIVGSVCGLWWASMGPWDKYVFVPNPRLSTG